MSQNNPAYDGALISELGVKRYLKGVSAKEFSNVNFLFEASSPTKHGKNVTLAATDQPTEAYDGHRQKPSY